MRLFLQSAILVGLSLSIGWGVRGNFGHEYGAMLPGVLAALAAVLMLGRPEWLPRMVYFAFFGALGWAFGGSISYMQVISYTHSGHLPSQIYGFGCLWVIGFLWAGMGGLATVWSAEASERRLKTLFRPLVWVFAFWLVLHFVFIWLARLEASFIDDRTWQRQASALYWMDSDWIEALTAGLALMAFDLWDRRGRQSASQTSRLLILLAIGAAVGWLLQQILSITGLVDRILVWPLVQYQADHELVAKLAAERGETIAQVQNDLLTNWPNWFQLFPQHVGWVLGAIVAALVYFIRWGRFRSGAGLLACMVAGWYIGFLLMPVLLGFGGAGLRMTPPRGDNWAGIVGVFLATNWWLAKHGYYRVIYAGILSGSIGGLGFAGAACLKLIMVAPGNPNLQTDLSIVEAWRFWQQSNWHSFLEQSYGLINGLAIFAAVWWLRRSPARFSLKPLRGSYTWTKVFAVAFVLLGVIYLNMQKNVATWVESGAVPEVMRMPGWQQVELAAGTWFNLAFLALAITVGGLILGHRTNPIQWLPNSWIGRGQLLYLVFLWVVVVMNFERALVNFAEGRLLTEGVIFINALLVTWMVSRWVPTETASIRTVALPDSDVGKSPKWTKLAVFAVTVLLVCVVAMPTTVRLLYGDRFAGHAGLQKRFGPDALWKTTPIFKSKRHS